MPPKKRKTKQNFTPLALAAAGPILLAAVLAFISSPFQASAFLSFLIVASLCVLLFWLAWRSLQPEKAPRWLLWLAIGAAGFRLLLGVVWLLALPAGGYDTPVQNAGYVMEDAYNRDTAAWELARTNEPLVSAFQGASPSDQYGGLLFLSAAIYRYLSPAQHLPLLVLMLAASVSGLAVAFTWAFTRRVWGERVGWLAAWALALYPEAALLGSSQMREAFTVCLVPLASLGLQRVLKRQSGWPFLIVAFATAAFFSWPFVSALALLLFVAYCAQTKWALLRDRRFWFAAVVAGALGVAYIFLVKDAAQLWLVQSARWQAYVSANASGWVARQFERMPLWSQIPFLIFYGILRPLLPAAVAAGGPPIWTIIGVWRAAGWTVLLAFLVYASYLAVRTRQAWALALSLAGWVVSLVASYRGGGDLWDSPRYRSAFAAIQIALAAWAWVESKESRDPWLRRTAVSLGLMILWFLPWYLRRYTAFTWPIVEIHQVIGLGIASAGLYLIWDWAGTVSRK
jgi:hypothetical protein